MDKVKLVLKYAVDKLNGSQEKPHHCTRFSVKYIDKPSVACMDIIHEDSKSFPKEIENVQNLSMLIMHGEDIVVPEEITSLMQLQAFVCFCSKTILLPSTMFGSISINLQILTLAGNNLTCIPDEIRRLSNLRWLTISGENITDENLSEEVWKLPNLRTLDIYLTRIRIIPPYIKLLTELNSLTLSHNEIEVIPPEIEHLTKLQSLNLSFNKIEFIAIEIKGLTQLKRLDLSANRILYLPPEIKHLTHLEFLCLNQNSISSLIPEIRYFTQLEELHLNDNHIETIPSEIGHLIKLKKLKCKNKDLKTSVHPHISRLENLKYVSVNIDYSTTTPATSRFLTGIGMKFLSQLINDNPLYVKSVCDRSSQIDIQTKPTCV